MAVSASDYCLGKFGGYGKNFVDSDSAVDACSAAFIAGFTAGESAGPRAVEVSPFD